MRKSDLKSGMVVKFRHWHEMSILIDNVLCEVDGKGFIKLDSYDENMCNIKDGDQWDIVEVYKCKHSNIMSCFIENELELIWSRKHTNWDKVPFGTKVRCWNGNTKYIGKFISYDYPSTCPFMVFVDRYTTKYWVNCELIEGPGEEVAIDEIQKHYRHYCNQTECISCKYDNYDESCWTIFIAQNYNVSRKQV